jgi:anaphase-promoting complex subunit 5
LRKLWAINSIDALHAFFQELNNYLARSPDQVRSNSPEPVRPPGRVILTRVSPLGIFIRRAQLEFTRIQFHDTVQLWIAFLKFRSPTEAAWRKRNPNAAISLDGSFSSLEPDVIRQACYGFHLDDDGEDAVNSSEDIERILEFQLDRLQSMTFLPLLLLGI